MPKVRATRQPEAPRRRVKLQFAARAVIAMRELSCVGDRSIMWGTCQQRIGAPTVYLWVSCAVLTSADQSCKSMHGVSCYQS